MGSVWVATHLGLDMRVALKVVTTELANHPSWVARFLREGPAAAKAKHPGIIHVLDTGVSDTGPWIAMELLKGESLRERLQREGRLSLEESLRIVDQVLAALAAVHAVGIVHRDLKPDNLFLEQTAEGEQVKILDFGSAKEVEGLTSLTATGAVIGTPNYLAPEQARNSKNVDERADIYAIGVILFECLSGTLPYEASSLPELIAKMFSEPPRQLEEAAPELPAAVHRLVHSCLSRDVDGRPVSASALRGSLAVAAQPHAATLPARGRPAPPGPPDARTRQRPSAESLAPTNPLRPSPPPTRRRAFVPLGIVLLLSGIVTAAWYALASDDEEDLGTERQLAPSGPPLTFGVVEFADDAYIDRQFGPLETYLQEAMNRPVGLRAVEPSELREQVVNGELDIAVLSPYRYVTAKDRDPRVRLIAVAVGPAGLTYEGMIVTLADSGIHELSDLRGTRFCYVDQNSSSGFIYPRALLRSVGIDPDDGFRSTRFTGDHSSSLRMLRDGLCDGAAVYRAILFMENSELDQAQFRILGSTARIPNDAYVAGPHLDEATVLALSDALTALEANTAETRRILGDTDLRGFAAPDDGLYDGVREISQYLNEEPRE